MKQRRFKRLMSMVLTFALFCAMDNYNHIRVWQAWNIVQPNNTTSEKEVQP
ncbi:MAG: hypothetical protein FWD35_01995 [Oscillospiraceae bacterium]|nr:hypothetical protein [Oscillospiraceae bacterium]